MDSKCNQRGSFIGKEDKNENVFRIKKSYLKSLSLIMRKEGLQNLTLRGHIEIQRKKLAKMNERKRNERKRIEIC